MKAQNKFILEDVTPGGKTHEKFVPKNLSQPQWSADVLCYVQKDSLFGVSFPSQKKRLLCSLTQLNSALKTAGGQEQKKLPSFTPYDKNSFYFQLKDRLFVYDTKQQTIVRQIKLPKEGESLDFCTENKRFACTLGSDLYITEGDTIRKISPKADKDISYGQAVARNEFGIFKGTFWSTKGRYLAFYRLDESRVTDYKQTDSSKKEPQEITIKYPFAGTSGQKVSIGVYDLKTGTTIYLNPGDPTDRYFTNLAWTPDDKQLLVAELNRGQNHCELKAYQASDGQYLRTLFIETSATYVEPEQAPFFIDKTQFIWQSERTGHNHLYLYSLKDTICKVITSGKWDVLDVLGYDEKTDKVLFAATVDSPLNKDLYQISLSNGEMQGLSSEGGQHTAQLSPSGKYLLDEYSSRTTPRKIDVIEVYAKKTKNILTAPNPYEGYALPEVRYGTLKAADDSTDLYYRMTLPIAFDATKKYPVIVIVYGGPHVQLVQNSWLGGSRGWELYLAQKGYVCFTLDNRGSTNRGQAFEEVIYKQLGTCEMADQIRGVAFLKSQPFVDAARMGVYGWSFGGFMATSLLCRYPDVFKVGVAGGAVTDWSLYEEMYGERYMQTPQLNPQGYAQSNVANYVQNLQAKLLLIHGDSDPIVVVDHAKRFLKAAEQNGKKIDTWFYQRHGHNINGKDRVPLFERITLYFDENL